METLQKTECGKHTCCDFCTKKCLCNSCTVLPLEKFFQNTGGWPEKKKNFTQNKINIYVQMSHKMYIVRHANVNIRYLYHFHGPADNNFIFKSY
jgi:hypothetical protein